MYQIKRVPLSIILLVLILPHPVGAELDLKEANVTDVAFTKTSDEVYTFDVTLIHDDDGEAPKYADLWIVEDINGTQLIRRDLLHSHGTIEFTRSGSGTIPDSISKVIIRAHDMAHGWGGQVALLDMIYNSIVFINQGTELQNFTTSDFSTSNSTNDVQSPSQLAGLPLMGIVTLTMFIMTVLLYASRGFRQNIGCS